MADKDDGTDHHYKEIVCKGEVDVVCLFVCLLLSPSLLLLLLLFASLLKHSFHQGGILDHKCIPQMWKSPEYPSQLHPHLLTLLQAFDVSFRMDGCVDIYGGRSLIPVMLNAHADERTLALSTTRGIVCLFVCLFYCF
jgi:hypothetical protein